MPGITKEEQLAHYIKRKAEKAAKTNKDKGNAFEKSTAASFQQEGIKAKRNSQAGAGGGIGRPDLSIMQGWAGECKNEYPLRIPKWWKKLNAEHSQFVRKMLIFKLENEELVIVRRNDLLNLAQDLIEAKGGEITFR